MSASKTTHILKLLALGTSMANGGITLVLIGVVIGAGTVYILVRNRQKEGQSTHI